MFSGLRNIRDLSTADPARVRPGVLLRSDTLTRLDDTGRAAFTAAGIATVLDLRTAGEVQNYGHFHGGATRHHISLLVGEVPPYQPGTPLARYWADVYLGLMSDAAPQIAEALTVLAGPHALPAVMHCAGGRDRTGVLAALILALLGVPDEAIAADYALSAAATSGDDPEYAQTPAEAMLLTLAGLRDRYGDIAGYARAIGVGQETIDQLRAQAALP